jgi:hypothetical protein
VIPDAHFEKSKKSDDERIEKGAEYLLSDSILVILLFHNFISLNL